LTLYFKITYPDRYDYFHKVICRRLMSNNISFMLKIFNIRMEKMLKISFWKMMQ